MGQEINKKNNKLLAVAVASSLIFLVLLYAAISEQQEQNKEKLRELKAQQQATDEIEDSEGALEEIEDKKAETGSEIKPVVSYEADAFDILNTPLKSLEKNIGLGNHTDSDYERYFEAAGAYVSFDEDENITGIYLKDGADKEAVISVLGIKTGDYYQEAVSKINNMGIDVLELSKESFMGSFYLGDKMDTLYSIIFTADNGRIYEIKAYVDNANN